MKTLALIGRGRWGSNYIETAKRSKTYRIKYVVGKDYMSLKDHNDIDGIIIATPANTHVHIARSFPDIPLLIEKPVAMSINKLNLLKKHRVMAGHTYLYNKNLEKKFDSAGEVSLLHFKLHNTEDYGSKVDPLYELVPHFLSLVVKYCGKVKVQYVKSERDRCIVTLLLKDGFATCEMGYNYKKKLREIFICGEKDTVFFDDSEPNVFSPLEKQLDEFVGFIDTNNSKTDMEHIIKVQKLMKEVIDNV